MGNNKAKKEYNRCSWRVRRGFTIVHKWIRRGLTYRRLLYKRILPTWFIVVLIIIVGILVCHKLFPGLFSFLTFFNGSTHPSKWDLIVDLCTLAMLAFAIRQVVVMKAATTMDISHQILKEDKQERKKKIKMISQASLLKKDYEKGEKTFSELLALYPNLYEYSYHYEYIGQLVYRNRLDFDLVFDTITFPDEVFQPFFSKNTTSKNEPSAKNIPKFLIIIIKILKTIVKIIIGLIKIIIRIIKPSEPPKKQPDTLIETIREKEKPDIWLGLEYLYRTYELKRAYNALTSPRARIEKSTQEGTSETSTSVSFRSVKADWKEIYNQMPL